ncbi:tail assembly protein [Achromobacter agilis]|uniref:Phage tail protein n=1 Tax=Achromobacter agilis TaxID=1353888 RepID=A0A446CL92_9BURK|nr:tail assembly protein [Achromobacter agilis]SSW68525.1 hypothetical protein AGI3411_03717 [Achromobacter agilis]
MSEKLREIRLYGWLGAQFGRTHCLAVESTAEAIRALCVVLPGFEQALASSEEKGVRYACFLGKRNIGEDEMRSPPGGDAIRIAPIPAGAKNGGLFQTILGAALVAVSFIIPPAGAFGVAALSAGTVGALGVSLAIGGVVQLTSPQQQGLSAKDGPENGASYNFNGPVNTSAQGNPVPILYGRMIVGSAVISAGIYAEDQV